MLREHIAPPPEVIWAIFLEDSPCCGVPAPTRPALRPSAGSSGSGGWSGSGVGRTLPSNARRAPANREGFGSQSEGFGSPLSPLAQQDAGQHMQRDLCGALRLEAEKTLTPMARKGSKPGRTVMVCMCIIITLAASCSICSADWAAARSCLNKKNTAWDSHSCNSCTAPAT